MTAKKPVFMRLSEFRNRLEGCKVRKENILCFFMIRKKN